MYSLVDILGQVAMRNFHLGSELERPIILLLVVHVATSFDYHWQYNERSGVLQLPDLHASWLLHVHGQYRYSWDKGSMVPPWVLHVQSNMSCINISTHSRRGLAVSLTLQHHHSPASSLQQLLWSRPLPWPCSSKEVALSLPPLWS